MTTTLAPLPESAAFLLDLKYQDMFEQASNDPDDFRCKGCGARMRRSKREDHYKAHKEAKMAKTATPKNKSKIPPEIAERVKKLVRSGMGVSTVGHTIEDEFPKSGKWYPSRVVTLYKRTTGESVSEARAKHALKRQEAAGTILPDDVLQRIVKAVNAGKGVTTVANELAGDKKLAEYGVFHAARVSAAYKLATGKTVREMRTKHALHKTTSGRTNGAAAAGQRRTRSSGRKNLERLVAEEEKAHQARGRKAAGQAAPDPKPEGKAKTAASRARRSSTRSGRATRSSK